MEPAIRRIIGALLVATASFGFLFCLLAVVQVWRLKPTLEKSLSAELDLASSLISTTDDSLAIAKRSLEAASGNVDSLEKATEILAQSLEDSQPIVDSLIALVGTDLPRTITATQTSLESAQTSALLIDNTLAALSRIPLLGLGRYRPDVPLNVALGQVSASMTGLPASLQTIEASLETANTNLEVMNLQVTLIGQDIQQINQNLAEARGVIDQYQASILVLQNQVSRAQAGLPPTLNRLAWLLTFILVWLGVMQIGLFTQGSALLRPTRES